MARPAPISPHLDIHDEDELTAPKRSIALGEGRQTQAKKPRLAEARPLAPANDISADVIAPHEAGEDPEVPVYEVSESPETGPVPAIAAPAKAEAAPRAVKRGGQTTGSVVFLVVLAIVAAAASAAVVLIFL